VLEASVVDHARRRGDGAARCPSPPASATAPPSEAPDGTILPADNGWNATISDLPVDPDSATSVAGIGAAPPLHTDVGSGTYHGEPIGIAYVVPSSQPPVPVTFTDASESESCLMVSSDSGATDPADCGTPDRS
jgi:hypothetical protein